MTNILERSKGLLARRRRLVRGLAIAAAVLVFTIGTAKALFQLRLSVDNGATFPVLVTDNGGGDLNPLPGVILWSGSLGGFNVIVNTAQSKPVIGSAVNPQLDLNVTASTAGGAGGTLWMEATDTDFLGGGSTLVGIAGGTQPGGATSTVQWDGFTSNTNTEFATSGGAHLAFAPTNANPFTFVGSTGGVIGSPYSLTNRVRITMGANAGTITGDFNLQVVPEGSSFAMLLPGLLPLGLVLKRRMKKA